jgi:hypothetical protein
LFDRFGIANYLGYPGEQDAPACVGDLVDVIGLYAHDVTQNRSTELGADVGGEKCVAIDR